MSTEMTDRIRLLMHRPAPEQCWCEGGKVSARCRIHGNAAPSVPASSHLDQKPTDAPATTIADAGGQSWRFTIPGAPMGKPRQTRSDKWKKRPCVVRYREWADKARAFAPKDLTKKPMGVSWVAYLPIAKSLSEKQRVFLTGKLHRQKPDRDNIDKAICDALWKDDSCISKGTLEKRWDDGQGARIELTVTL